MQKKLPWNETPPKQNHRDHTYPDSSSSCQFFRLIKHRSIKSSLGSKPLESRLNKSTRQAEREIACSESKACWFSMALYTPRMQIYTLKLLRIHYQSYSSLASQRNSGWIHRKSFILSLTCSRADLTTDWVSRVALFAFPTGSINSFFRTRT